MKAAVQAWLARLSQQDGGLLVAVLGGVRWSLLYRVAGAGFAFVIAVLTARILELDAYGRLQFVIGVLNLVFIFGGLGLAQIIVREVAVGANDQAWGTPRGIIRFTHVAAFVATLVLGIGAYWAIIRPADLGVTWLYWIGLALFLTRQVRVPLDSTMNGLRRIEFTGLGDFARDLAIVIGLALLWVLLPEGVVADRGVMVLRLVATALSLILLAVLLRRVVRALPGDWYGTARRIAGRAWIKAGIPLMVVAATSVVFLNADIMMIGIFLESESVGLYHAANRVAQFVAQAMGITILPVAPVLASLSAKGDYVQLRALLRRITLFGVALGVPLVAM